MPALLTAPTFRHQVLTYLRDRIMSGELPPGTLLTPTAVAKQLNTSAMPVREALRVLEQEGLIEVAGRRYTRVATPSRAVADEAYPLLWLLEGHAIRQAARLPETALADADRANATLRQTSNTAERMRAVVQFHRAVCSAAGPITQTMLDLLYSRIGLLESVYSRRYEPQVASDEHSEIVAALRLGDVVEAARLNEAHWRRGYAAILPFLEEG
jgi:DNA-binding GntR family transcriptional regulator